MLSSPAELSSTLSTQACLERLKDHVDSRWTLSGTRPVVGSVKNDTLYATKRISYRNSFQTRMVATLQPNGAGTRIHCRFGLHPFVVGFVSLWIAIATLFAVADISITLAHIRANGGLPSNLAGLAFSLAFPCFGIGLLVFGRWLARNERAFLISFLCTTIGAHEAPMIVQR